MAILAQKSSFHSLFGNLCKWRLICINSIPHWLYVNFHVIPITAIFFHSCFPKIGNTFIFPYLIYLSSKFSPEKDYNKETFRHCLRQEDSRSLWQFSYNWALNLLSIKNLFLAFQIIRKESIVTASSGPQDFNYLKRFVSVITSPWELKIFLCFSILHFFDSV